MVSCFSYSATPRLTCELLAPRRCSSRASGENEHTIDYLHNDDEMSLLQSVQKATNITWHEGSVSQTDRESLTGQKGATVWFTGLSGASSLLCSSC